MSLKVDQDKCISCGTCVNICPEIFAFNDNGKAEILTDSTEEIKKSESKIKEAIENCPVEAISQ